MHPPIEQAVGQQRIEETQRIARQRQLAGESRGEARRGFSRYFSHAREGHAKSLRRADRGAPGTGPRTA